MKPTKSQWRIGWAGALLLVLAACAGRAHGPGVPGAQDSGAPPGETVTPSTPDAGPDAGVDRVVALGYYTGDQESYDAITTFQADLTMVSLDLYTVQSDGSITGTDALNARGNARSHGLDAFACLSNYSSVLHDFDPALAHSAMVNHRAAVIDNVLNIASAGFQGINIDFESLAYSANIADDRAAYTAFIHALAARVRAAGLKLMLSIPAKSVDLPSKTWTYPFDLAALAPDMDYLQLMTYDENGPRWSAPGPVSGRDWVEASVAYAASLVSPQKILIGLPAYGYDWDLTASSPSSNTYVGSSLSWKDTPALLAKPGAAVHWDAASSSPYVDYTSGDGHLHQAWYEDPRSIAAKMALVAPRGLGGLSMWALGSEDGTFWQATRGGP